MKDVQVPILVTEADPAFHDSDQNLIIERLKMHSKEATYADPKKQLGLQPLYPQDISR